MAICLEISTDTKNASFQGFYTSAERPYKGNEEDMVQLMTH